MIEKVRERVDEILIDVFAKLKGLEKDIMQQAILATMKFFDEEKILENMVPKDLTEANVDIAAGLYIVYVVKTAEQTVKSFIKEQRNDSKSVSKASSKDASKKKI